MQFKNKPADSQLAAIVRLLSEYHALTIPQLGALFPELSHEKLHLLLGRLERSGRIRTEQDMVFHPCTDTADAGTIAAFWVLLDFFPAVTFHCASDFPAVLTFHAQADAYEVIHVPEEKELLIDHALSSRAGNGLRRLVVIEDAAQIPLLSFPGILAFCMVQPDGKVQYLKRQGATET